MISLFILTSWRRQMKLVLVSYWKYVMSGLKISAFTRGINFPLIFFMIKFCYFILRSFNYDYCQSFQCWKVLFWDIIWRKNFYNLLQLIFKYIIFFLTCTSSHKFSRAALDLSCKFCHNHNSGYFMITSLFIKWHLVLWSDIV